MKKIIFLLAIVVLILVLLVIKKNFWQDNNANTATNSKTSQKSKVDNVINDKKIALQKEKVKLMVEQVKKLENDKKSKDEQEFNKNLEIIRETLKPYKLTTQKYKQICEKQYPSNSDSKACPCEIKLMNQYKIPLADYKTLREDAKIREKIRKVFYTPKYQLAIHKCFRESL